MQLYAIRQRLICSNSYSKGERVKYKHTRERDRFYKLPYGRKIRVTTDQQTGEVEIIFSAVSDNEAQCINDPYTLDCS